MNIKEDLSQNLVENVAQNCLGNDVGNQFRDDAQHSDQEELSSYNQLKQYLHNHNL